MRLAVVFGFIASVFAPLIFANGYDSFVRHELGALADLSPTAIVATSDGGMWITAQEPHDDTDPYQLVHLDANGHRIAGLYFPQSLFYGTEAEDVAASLYPLADQGVLEVRRDEYSCTIRRLGSDGKIKFERISYARMLGKNFGARVLFSNYR